MKATTGADRTMCLPPSMGGTTCDLTLRRLESGQPVLVLLTERPDNTGLSVWVNFGQVAAFVRAELAFDGHEPLWMVRWRQRALASRLFGPAVSCDHIMVPVSNGWWPRAVPVEVTTRWLAH